MIVEENVYIFDDVNEWLDYTSRHESKMVSPGGFAMKAGVARQTVNNWIYRDRIIRYFKCGQGRRGEYGLIPLDDLEKVKERLKR